MAAMATSPVSPLGHGDDGGSVVAMPELSLVVPLGVGVSPPVAPSASALRVRVPLTGQDDARLDASEAAHVSLVGPELFEISSTAGDQTLAIACSTLHDPSLRDFFSVLAYLHRDCSPGSRMRSCIEHACECFAEHEVTRELALTLVNCFYASDEQTVDVMYLRRFVGPLSRAAAMGESEHPGWSSPGIVKALLASVAAASPGSSFSMFVGSMAATSSASP